MSMRWLRQAGWLGMVTAALGAVWGVTPVKAQIFAQFGATSKFQLTGPVNVDEVDSDVAKQLQTIRAFLSNQQWSDAIEKLCDLLEIPNGQLVAITPSRYVALADHCHMLLAQLPPEGLAQYRARVDPQAKRWYDEGLARHEAAPLQKLVDQMFCSSWGDNALLALGEMALESGQYGAARSYWEQILPLPPQAGGAPTWLAYPDSELSRADVLARLVLVSILEGSGDRARQELTLFGREFPQAEGRLGGRQVNYVAALSALLGELPTWTPPALGGDWPTFAGGPDRNGIATGNIDIGAPEWRVELPPCPPADVGYVMRRTADDHEEPLSYHPVVVGHRLFVNTLSDVRAIDVRTGKLVWGGDDFAKLDANRESSVDRRGGHNNTYGAPRFTMTAYGDRLYARMGNPITSGNPSELPTGQRAGFLVCLEAVGGRLIWDTRRSLSDEEFSPGWAFEGSPVCDGTNVYVGMRLSGARAPRSYVACLDALTGRLRWRQFIAGASTPAQGEKNEITHSLLTLHAGTLYYNTNLGAVAALDTQRGRLKWVALYPRVPSGDWTQRAAHFNRDLNPCVYDRGKLYVAPSDSQFILAYDAHSGRELWRTSHASDAVHLLGVHDGRLVASGDLLWSFDTTPHYDFGESAGDYGGKTIDVYPEGKSTPHGFGRGVIVDDTVYWPTRDSICTRNLRTATSERQPIDLRPRKLTGGNLLVADGHLLIVTNHEIIAFELPQTTNAAELPIAAAASPPDAATSTAAPSPTNP